MKLRSIKNAELYCPFTHAASDVVCHRPRIPVSELESIVLESIRKKMEELPGDCANPEYRVEQETQLGHLEDAKRILYEKFVLGEMNAETYKAESAALDVERGRIKSVDIAAKEDTAKIASIDELRRFVRDAPTTELSQALVDELIEKVCVFPECRVEIVWRGVKRK